MAEQNYASSDQTNFQSAKTKISDSVVAKTMVNSYCSTDISSVTGIQLVVPDRNITDEFIKSVQAYECIICHFKVTKKTQKTQAVANHIKTRDHQDNVFAYFKHSPNKKLDFIKAFIGYKCKLCDKKFFGSDEENNAHAAVDHKKSENHIWNVKQHYVDIVGNPCDSSTETVGHKRKKSYYYGSFADLDVLGLKLDEFIYAAQSLYIGNGWPQSESEYFCECCNYWEFEDETELNAHIASPSHLRMMESYPVAFCKACQRHLGQARKMKRHVSTAPHIRLVKLTEDIEKKAALYWDFVCKSLTQKSTAPVNATILDKYTSIVQLYECCLCNFQIEKNELSEGIMNVHLESERHHCRLENVTGIRAKEKDYVRSIVGYWCTVCDCQFISPNGNTNEKNVLKHKSSEGHHVRLIMRSASGGLTLELGGNTGGDVDSVLTEETIIEFSENDEELSDIIPQLESFLSKINTNEINANEFVAAAIEVIMGHNWPQPTSEFHCRLCNYKAFSSKEQLDAHLLTWDHKEFERTHDEAFCLACQFHNGDASGMSWHTQVDFHKKLSKILVFTKQKAIMCWKLKDTKKFSAEIGEFESNKKTIDRGIFKPSMIANHKPTTEGTEVGEAKTKELTLPTVDRGIIKCNRTVTNQPTAHTVTSQLSMHKKMLDLTDSVQDYNKLFRHGNQADVNLKDLLLPQSFGKKRPGHTAPYAKKIDDKQQAENQILRNNKFLKQRPGSSAQQSSQRSQQYDIPTAGKAKQPWVQHQTPHQSGWPSQKSNQQTPMSNQQAPTPNQQTPMPNQQAQDGCYSQSQISQTKSVNPDSFKSNMVEDQDFLYCAF